MDWTERAKCWTELRMGQEVGLDRARAGEWSGLAAGLGWGVYTVIDVRGRGWREDTVTGID